MTASFGSGHVIATKGLLEAFLMEDITPEVIDIVLQGGKRERIIASFYAFLMRRGHVIWKTYREKIMPIKKGASIRKIYEILHKNKLIKEIEQIRPDIIISTMDTASVIVSLYKKKHPEVSVYTVVTDYVAHPLWVWKNMDGYFVGSNLVQEFLIEHGIKKEKIVISGIPLRVQFEKKTDRTKARKALDISQDRQVVLIAAGTYKSVPVEEIIKAISSNIFSYAIVLAGNSSDNVVEFAGILKEYGVLGRVVSYTENMDEFMAASDLYISKAGGLTVAECFAAGLPALYINNFPGHEEGNAKYAAAVGAAVMLPSIENLGATIEDLLKNPQKLSKMRQNAEKIAQVDSSKIVVSKVLHDFKN